MNRYIQFSGRAPRAEFWYFQLFFFLLAIGAAIIDATVLSGLPVASAIVYLALLFPLISVFVRRLHDRNRSGWWYWAYLIPLVGPVLLFVWMVMRGTPGPNRFGPNPLAE